MGYNLGDRTRLVLLPIRVGGGKSIAIQGFSHAIVNC